LELKNHGKVTRTYKHEDKISYQRGNTVTEWFINDQRGLEQGWTFSKRPDHYKPSELLQLHLTVRGELRPKVSSNQHDIEFIQPCGNTAVNYNGLKAWDATGKTLEAWFDDTIRNSDEVIIHVNDSDAIYPVTVDPLAQQAYLKASNTSPLDNFGYSVAVSGDTVVIGAFGESSSATEVNGNQADKSAESSGAAYVFVRNGATWTQQAYLKASNAEAGDNFGHSVSISGDLIVIGAPNEDSIAFGINGQQADNSSPSSGAAYVFARDGTSWSQQAYLKPSNTGAYDTFGYSVAISGETIVVGAYSEDSDATSINGQQDNDYVNDSGAAYIFTRNESTWSQQAYVKPSNNGNNDLFGYAVAISGETAIIGAFGEDSGATGVNGNQANNSIADSGAAYVFIRDGENWIQQAYLKASNTGSSDYFGISVSISGDTILVGAYGEDSISTGTTGSQANNSASAAGAAYIFIRNDSTWNQQAYLKASNPQTGDYFGYSVAVSGNTAIIGAYGEDSSATGINSYQADNSAELAGAAYTFTRNEGLWSQLSYLKASNTDNGDYFGISVAISGNTTIIGAYGEDSGSLGVNSNQSDDSASASGSSYIYFQTAKYTIATSAVHGSISGAGNYDISSIATLTASPNPGYIFAGWTGDANGTDPTTQLLMDSNKTVSATFSPDLADTDGDGYTNHDEITIHLSDPNNSASIPGDPDADGFFAAGLIEGSGLMDSGGGDTMILNSKSIPLSSGIAMGGYFTISDEQVTSEIAEENYAALLAAFAMIS
jgi:uncharacterized repeat protein (TIGR02543 family)